MESRVQAVLDADRRRVHVQVNEAKWLGQRATLSIVQRVCTRRRGGEQGKLEWSIGPQVLERTQTLSTDALARAYHYAGSVITIEWLLRVKIDDGILFDSAIEVPITLPDPGRRTAAEGEAARQLYEPTDHHSLRARFQGLLPDDRRKLVMGAVAAVIVIAANLALGWRDAAVPEADTWLYDHMWRAGDRPNAELPITKAIMGSVLLAVGSWAWMVRRFARYVRFQIRIRKLPGRHVRLLPSQLFRGSARVPLDGAEVRVVVANVEHGTVRPWLGGVYSEDQAARAICLFRQTLVRVPANAPIENYLHGEIDFAPLYEALYAPSQIGTIGVVLKWRIQFLHPQFTDRHADLVVDQLQLDDFLPRSSPAH